MDSNDEKVLADIAQHGCHIIHVLEEGDLPPFSYSVGIQKSSGAPEVIVIGLKKDIAHFTINEYNSRIRSGESFETDRLYPGFLEGFEVLFVPVGSEHYPEYLGWNRWLYGGDQFKTLQVVYPTTDGIWPWNERASKWFRNRQRLLAAGGIGPSRS
ncbi:MAG TPA: DUF4262 domain-containing protein [Candidatus Binatia bacterium]|jgi:hypothetical protein